MCKCSLSLVHAQSIYVPDDCFKIKFLIILSLKIIYLFYVYEYIHIYEYAVFMHRRHCEPTCGCWELNSGPLEEQTVLLTSEPSLQPKLGDSYGRAGRRINGLRGVKNSTGQPTESINLDPWGALRD